MRMSIYLAVAAACTLLLLAYACGGKHAHTSPTGVAVSGSQALQTDTALSQTDALTDEDRRLMAMPYEERLEYLLRKYRDLVFELHGIVIDDDVGPSKAARSLDEEHRVEGDNNNPPPPDEQWYRQQTVSEYINLQRDGDNWQWTLTFLERLYADYDFNGVAAIGDITPLAMYYGDFWEQYNPGEWPNNEDPHLDRTSNHNGQIDIADITPLAANFGKKLIGYNVYFRTQDGGEWYAEPISQWRDEDRVRKEESGPNWDVTGYRRLWKSAQRDEEKAVRDVG